MFKKEEIDKAVRIQKLGYKFLMYITYKIDHKKYSFSRIHNNDSSADVVSSWVKDYYDYLPQSILPVKGEIKEFSNYFASYMTTSFELNEIPEKTNRKLGCYCDVCLQFGNLSHLKSISPRNPDRELAKQKRIEIVRELAEYHKIDLSESILKDLSTNKLNIRDAALLAYAKALFKRIQTSEGGVYILALWREFAWSQKGTPIQDFELSSDNILSAMKRLESKIKNAKGAQEG